MEIHSVDLYGDVRLASNAGTANQVLTSQGVGVQAIWANATSLTKLYAATDKPAQTIVVGPADITWNTPAADAMTGITFNGTTQFTLLENRTYEIQVRIKPTVAALAYNISIVDTANNPIGSLNQPIAGLASLATEFATAFFRPLVNTAIKVRMTSAVALTIGASSWIIIKAVD